MTPKPRNCVHCGKAIEREEGLGEIGHAFCQNEYCNAEFCNECAAALEDICSKCHTPLAYDF